jgi:hypothetical protein
MVRTLVMSLTAVALSTGPVLAQAPPPPPAATGCQALIDQVVAATNNRLDYSANWAKDKLIVAGQLMKDGRQVECMIKVEEAANDIQLTLKK